MTLIFESSKNYINLNKVRESFSIFIKNYNAVISGVWQIKILLFTSLIRIVCCNYLSLKQSKIQNKKHKS